MKENESKARTQSVAECIICNRPPGRIICKICGHVRNGRVRKSCAVHPTVVHLMDQEFCAKCKSAQLVEFQAQGMQRN